MNIEMVLFRKIKGTKRRTQERIMKLNMVTTGYTSKKCNYETKGWHYEFVVTSFCYWWLQSGHYFSYNIFWSCFASPNSSQNIPTFLPSQFSLFLSFSPLYLSLLFLLVFFLNQHSSQNLCTVTRVTWLLWCVQLLS